MNSSWLWGFVAGLFTGASLGVVAAGLLSAAGQQPPATPGRSPVWQWSLGPALQSLPDDWAVVIDCGVCADGVSWSAKLGDWRHWGGYEAIGVAGPPPHEVEPVLRIRRPWAGGAA